MAELNGSKQFVGADAPFTLAIASVDGSDLTGSSVYLFLQDKPGNILLELSTANSGMTITSVTPAKLELAGNIPNTFTATFQKDTKIYYFFRIHLPNSRRRIAREYRGIFDLLIP